MKVNLTNIAELSPLANTLQCVSILAPQLQANVGTLDSGWLKASDFLTSEFVHEALTRQKIHFPDIDKRTGGAFLLGNYVWYLSAVAIMAYLLEDRVPDLSAENVALRFETFTWEEDGKTAENERMYICFLSNRMAVVAGDLASGERDIVALSDRDQLREWLRVSLETHIMLLIEHIYADTQLGRRAQWNLVSDTCAAMFLYAGELTGNTVRGQADGLAFIRAELSPMKNPKTGYITLEHGNHCETFRVRGGCCRYYMLPEKDKCTTCVLRTEQDRNQLLLDYMRKKYFQDNSQ